MPIKVKVNPYGSVTFYSRAGDTISGGEEYEIQYSIDNGSNWQYVAGPLSSTTCTQHGTFLLPEGTQVRLIRDSNQSEIKYNLNDDSSTCPPNNDDLCGGTVILLDAVHDVALTAFVSGSDLVDC